MAVQVLQSSRSVRGFWNVLPRFVYASPIHKTLANALMHLVTLEQAADQLIDLLRN